MFDQLSERLQATLSGVRSRGKLSESDIDAAMREIRLALLEADVNFKVVKSFTKQVKERCVGAGVLESLDPGQQVVKIVNEELASLMGGSGRDLAFASAGPTVILMAGLQGSGKTTACAKLAKHLRGQQKSVALAACDLQRPAAVEQLVTMGERAWPSAHSAMSTGSRSVPCSKTVAPERLPMVTSCSTAAGRCVSQAASATRLPWSPKCLASFAHAVVFPDP